MGFFHHGHQPPGPILNLARGPTRFIDSLGQASHYTWVTASLVAEHAWSPRTATSRDSQLRACLVYSACNGRPALPVSEAHVLLFIG